MSNPEDASGRATGVPGSGGPEKMPASLLVPGLLKLTLSAGTDPVSLARVQRALEIAHACFTQFLCIAHWPEEHGEALNAALQESLTGHRQFLGGFRLGHPPALPRLHARPDSGGWIIECAGKLEPLRLIDDFLQGWKKQAEATPNCPPASLTAHEFSQGLAGWRWVQARKKHLLERSPQLTCERVVNTCLLNPLVFLLEAARLPSLTSSQCEVGAG